MVIKFLLPLTVVCGVFATSIAQAVCPFNVAGGATTDATRDGVLLVRYARGLRGAALVVGTLATATTVEATIAANLAKLDINGNGVFDLDDAAIISRNVFGFDSAAWLPDGRAGTFATRTTAAKVQSFVDADCVAPTISAPTVDQFVASRFLIQTTFGPSRSDIAAFLTLPGADHAARASAWINAQMALPRSQTHTQFLLARKTEYDAIPRDFGSEMTRESFWAQALSSPDQLRQRMAFALSEILVVSSNGGSNNPFELAAYLDLLAENGFTNYRDLLYKVALSPAMGRYLSHLKNDGSNANPNENFAREVLQLFGVGLFMLGPDGEKLTSGGQPIATYSEDTVKGFAKVFTGLSYDDPYCKTGDPSYGIPRTNCADGYSAVHPDWNWSPDRDDIPPNPTTLQTFPAVLAGWKRAMIPYPGRHSALSKQLLTYSDANPVAACSNAVVAGNQLLPAIITVGSGVTTRTKVNVAQANDVINKAIDNIFCHPNVGPFVSKNLIRFFVTSTPTPAYVSRVTSAFNNTNGVRGDMQAVMRAVLLDSEAIQASGTPPQNFGKLKEPMLRLSAIYRGFNATSASGRYQLHYGLDEVETGISQAPLQSPTVFNYFHPEFAPPGPVANNSANGPEFELTTTTAIASTQNMFGSVVTYSDGGAGNSFNTNLVGRYNCNIGVSTNADPAGSSRQHCLLGDMSELFSLHADSSALFDYLNLVLLGGSLNATNKSALVTALDAAYPTTPAPVLAGNPPSRAQISTYNNDVTNNWQPRKRNRVRGALWLAVHLPEFQIQR